MAALEHGFDPAPWLRVPYRPKGVSPETGWDCAGLVRFLGALHYGFDLPEWAALYAGTDRADRSEIGAAVAAQAPCFERGAPGLAYPILVFLRFGAPMHLGLICRPGWFLHADDGVEDAQGRRGGTYCAALESGHWQRRLWGAFRYAG